MMWQCCFISCNKCTIQVRNVDNAGGYACEGREYVQKSVFSSQFSSETKTSLNKYNLQKKKKKKSGTSLENQQLRIHLSMQWVQV